MSGPADQARLSQFSNYGVLLRSGLLGVGGDDLKIPSCAEREEGVLRTTPGMNAAKCSANARARLDEGDAAVEIAAAKKNVIEQRRHLIRRPRKCWRGKSTTGQAQKDSARNESQHWRLLWRLIVALFRPRLHRKPARKDGRRQHAKAPGLTWRSTNQLSIDLPRPRLPKCVGGV